MTKDKVALINSRSAIRFQFLQNELTAHGGMMIRLGILILCVSGKKGGYRTNFFNNCKEMFVYHFIFI